MKSDVIITLGVLCYHNEEETCRCIKALCAEYDALADLVGNADITIHDNSVTNIGQGAGRNKIIEKALALGSTHIFFIDGDIRVVPGSIYLMLTHMLNRPRLGCLCPHPAYQTNDPDKATERAMFLGSIRNDVRSACTGYALYNAQVFRNGLRFEESGPFSGPGWGLEDDDMYLQLITNGWGVDYFTGMIYLQTRPRSSWQHLKADGYDVNGIFEARKEYFINKWRGIDPAILLNIKGLSLRGLDA